MRDVLLFSASRHPQRKTQQRVEQDTDQACGGMAPQLPGGIDDHGGIQYQGIHEGVLHHMHQHGRPDGPCQQPHEYRAALRQR